MGRFSGLWRFASSWYVSGPVLTVLGVVIGALVFFYVVPGKPKIGVIDIPFTVINDDSAFVISTFLEYARRDDSIKGVFIRLNSPGGGAAASEQLYFETRALREEKPVVIVMNDIVASGGYMMAYVANKIISAPFAIVGSIGVLAQLPNFNRLLADKGIDYEQIYSGKYKRTLTIFGENTKEGREKFTEQIEDTYRLFKEFVAHNRPSLDMDKVATGEHWYGLQALELTLIDEIKTSDDYLLDVSTKANLYELNYKQPKI